MKTKFLIDPIYQKQATESIDKDCVLEGVYYLNAGDIRIWFRDKNGKLDSKLEPIKNDSYPS